MPTSTLRRGLIRLPFGNLLAKGGAQRSQQWQRVVSHPRHRIFNVVAQVELAYLVDKHFCAIVPCEEGDATEGS